MIFESISPKQLPLTKYERIVSKGYGCIDEGIIEYIFDTIKPENRYCIEFGARDGERAHTRFLVEQHRFSALYLEADPAGAKLLKQKYADMPHIHTEQAFINRSNIEEIFKRNSVPEEPFILLIDIDGNDYHVWQAIESCRPQAICIEFNSSYPPDEMFVIEYKEDFVWNGDDYYGASIKAMVELGKEKGYELIHCTSGGDNLFFVKKEYFPGFAIADNSPEVMYQLPQYGRNGRAINGKGHPVSLRNSTLLQRIIARLKYRLYSIPRRLVKHRMKQDVILRTQER